jgi:hypothetical protein
VGSLRGFEDARKIAEGETKQNKAAAEKPNGTSARARVALNFYRDIYRIEIIAATE